MIGLGFVVAMVCITIQKCRNCCRKYDCCHTFTDCGHRIFCEDNVVSAADLVEAEYHLRLRALASALKEDQVVESLQNRADLSETSSESDISQVLGDTSPPPYEDVVRTEVLPCMDAKDKGEASTACDENGKDIKAAPTGDDEKNMGVVNLACEDGDIVLASTSHERGVACWGSDDDETGIKSTSGNTRKEVASKRVYETDMVIENVNEECVSSEDVNENDILSETRGTQIGNRVEVSEASSVVNGDRGAVSEPRGGVNGERGAVSETRGGVNGVRGAISEHRGIVNGERGAVSETRCGVNGDRSAVSETRGTLSGNRVEVSEASGVGNGDRDAVSEHRGVVNGERGAVSETRGVVNGERGAVSETSGVVYGDRGAVSEPRGVVNGERGAVSEASGVVNGDRGVVSDTEAVLMGKEARSAKAMEKLISA